MKFTIQTNTLKSITNTLTKIITKDISSGGDAVHIITKSNIIYFKTQQFDFSVVYSSKVEDCLYGSVSISISIFDGIISSLIDSLVTVELKDKTLTIQTNTSTTSMYILEDDSDSVSISKPEKKPSLSIKREIMLRGFKNVQYAAAESFIKPEIASVYLYTKDNSIYFVSTDAFRLSEMRFLADNIQDDVGVLIPIKSVSKLMRIFEGISDSDVSLYILDDGIYAETDSVIVKMNGVNGSFPDYKNIMPIDFSLEIITLKSDITNFLKKARLFADKLNKLSITISDEKNIMLEFSNETVGTTTNTIPAVIKGAVDSLPAFNYRFVSDVLSVIGDDRVIFSLMNDQTKPLMIRGSEDTALTAVVSPLLDKQD